MLGGILQTTALTFASADLRFPTADTPSSHRGTTEVTCRFRVTLRRRTVCLNGFADVTALILHRHLLVTD
jgi:hypothetical protein